MTTVRNKELVTEDMSFMEDFVGAGLDSITTSATAVSYLSLVQPDSSVEDEENPAGTWRNSATGRNYGNMVKVIPLAFRTVWNERDADTFRTVGRYDVQGIDVEIRQPPKGKRGYPKMYNPESGNEVQELFVYAVILPDYPEDGVLFFNPTVGSMKACKSWNSQLKGQILPNGAQAPIFAYQWNLIAELTPNPQQPNKNIARFTKVVKDAITGKELFTTYVHPQLKNVQQSVLQITSNIDEVEE